MKKITRLSTLVLLVMIGCGGSGGNSGGSVSGTVHGTSLNIQDAISASVTQTPQGITTHTALVVMANASNLCGDIAGNISHPNEQGVAISMIDVNGATFTTPTAPGTYAIYQSGSPPAKAASLSVTVDDATCKGIAASSAKATSGTITLSAVSGNAFSGSFDVALDSGDHITGSFSPEECPGIQTQLDMPTQPVCM
jgi:hypothetical protein